MYEEKSIGPDEEIRFINMIKSRRILYDRNVGKGISLHSKINLTNKEWERIARTFGMPDKEFAIKKWRYFRDRFVREYRVRSKSEKLPANFSPWVHYENMRFIEDHIRNRKSIDYYKDKRKSMVMSPSHIELEFIETESSNGYQNELDAENTDENDGVEHDDEYINEMNDNKTLSKFKSNQNQEEEKSLSYTDNKPSKSYSMNQSDNEITIKRKYPRREYDDDDPEYSFALYMLAEMRQMPKRRRNQLKAMIVNFILNDENEDKDEEIN